jgi:hypothetical protein
VRPKGDQQIRDSAAAARPGCRILSKHIGSPVSRYCLDLPPQRVQSQAWSYGGPHLPRQRGFGTDASASSAYQPPERTGGPPHRAARSNPHGSADRCPN